MTDEQLVASYLHSGSQEVLGQLIDRNLDRVRRVVYPMVLNHADADDVVQEVFVRVVNGLGSFRQESEFATWLRRVTVNTVYGFLKKRHRRQMPSTSAGEGVEASHDCPPDHAVLSGELDEAIRHALQQLAPELRGALVLTVFEEVAPAEVAAIEGCSRATVYWRVHRARKKLRELLKDWI